MKFGRNAVKASRNNKADPRWVMENELDVGENLIWAGQPESSLSHKKGELMVSFFGLVFFALSLFPIYKSWETIISGGRSAFPLFDILLVFAGAALFVYPLWQILKAKKTTYALTTKRLIIRSRLPHINLKSWLLSSIKKLEREDSGEGLGNIFFAEEVGSTPKSAKKSVRIGFIGILESKHLELEINKLLDGEGLHD